MKYNNPKTKIKVLFVGQTPPPFGGQAIMQQVMLEGPYSRIKFYHVRMAFSKEMEDVGKIQLSKIFHLFSVVLQIYYCKFRHRIDILYFPPAGPNRVPFFRDLVILLSTRWLFKKTIFHFRAGGLSELPSRLSWLENKLFHLAYDKPDLAIRLSELSPADGLALQAKKHVVIPNGLADHYPLYKANSLDDSTTPLILFVGVIRESKGVMTLLEACKQLCDKNIPFTAKLVGRYESKKFLEQVEQFIRTNNLSDRIQLEGVALGAQKWDLYNRAALFCLPTFFESESVAVVVLEAMQFNLPVVSTYWRGIPSAVIDGESGFLVNIKDSVATARKLEILLKDSELRGKMGNKGREIFLKKFTVQAFWENIEQAVVNTGLDSP